MQRLVQPEILDNLPACNLDAVASRRDLVKINHLMGNYRWIRRQVRRCRPSKTDRFLEIGAGDGTLARQLIPALPRHSFAALDQCSQPEDWPAHTAWCSGDILCFSEYSEYTHLLANLILHHFDAKSLAQIGDLIQAGGIREIIACEPCRRPLHQWQLRAGKWIGFNYVTLHDGCISVAAGFRGDELPQLLGLSPSQWSWRVDETWMGAYRMRARRR
ncbi:MAG: hypothetical protein EA353_09260 [Puniceicoccaceae bacterium]|nr:MAG: hypothetical protein EA353_09260 [Puniceicoccaceae bacterium]